MSPNTTSRTTTDHDEIRRWAKERGVRPAAGVRGKPGEETTGICLPDPNAKGRAPLEEITWEEWFQRFEESKLALLYQEQIANGERSKFNRIVSRSKVEKVENAVGGRGRSASDKAETAKALLRRPLARGASGTATVEGRSRSSKVAEPARERSLKTRPAGTQSHSKEKQPVEIENDSETVAIRARHSRTVKPTR